MAILHQSYVTATYGPSVSLKCMADSLICPKTATFNNLFMTQALNQPLGRGEDGLGRHLVPPPPPHQRILLFCLILLNYMTSGVFSRCKLSLLKQYIFFILTQPSWDDYLLLYSPKSSIHGTAPVWSIFWSSMIQASC